MEAWAQQTMHHKFCVRQWKSLLLLFFTALFISRAFELHKNTKTVLNNASFNDLIYALFYLTEKNNKKEWLQKIAKRNRNKNKIIEKFKDTKMICVFPRIGYNWFLWTLKDMCHITHKHSSQFLRFHYLLSAMPL